MSKKSIRARIADWFDYNVVPHRMEEPSYMLPTPKVKPPRQPSTEDNTRAAPEGCCPFLCQQGATPDMEQKEKIKVYANIVKGKTVCICKQENKMCDKDCEPTMVERDRYAGWEKMARQDKYGKVKP